MIIRPRFVSVLVLLLAALLGCGSPLSTTPTSSPDKLKPISILVGLDSTAYIKRDGWIDYQPIGFGTLVYPTDLLKTDGKISFLCSDLQTVLSFTGSGRNPCPLPTNDQILKYDQMFFSSGSRGAPALGVPYIYYPRSTTILEAHPVFSWHKTNASSYAVELWEGATLVWAQSEVEGNAMKYPTNAPSLEAGKDYLLVVKDNDTGKISGSDPNKGLGFQVVSEAQLDEIVKQKESISHISDLDPVAQKLVLAMYYDQLNVNGRGLWGEAGKLFKEVTNARLDAPAVHLQAGDVLAKMKLWDEAQAEYEVALSQAETLNDMESQANAFNALWHISSDQTQFDQAISIYETLGANDKAQRLKKEMNP